MDMVVVTGSSRGLGLAISKLLLQEGYSVVGISRNRSSDIEALKSEFTDRFFFEAYDFSYLKGIQDLVRKITSKYGSIFGLVNNAALGHDGVLATMHESQIEELISVNIEAPILLTKYVSRSMLIKQRGRIVNISSVIGSTGFSGLSVYGATKASLSGFTRSLARELGKGGITVNCIAPGYMQTEMTSGLQGEKLKSIERRSALRTLAAVDDVAGAVSYLLSHGAKSVTGITLTVDAGSTA